MNEPDKISQEDDTTIPTSSNESVGNPTEVATPSPELPDTLATHQVAPDISQESGTINGDIQAHEQPNRPQASVPRIVAASREALNSMRTFIDNLTKSIESNPNLANAEMPSALFPSHLPAVGRPRTDGPTYRAIAHAMDRVKDGLERIEQATNHLEMSSARTHGAITGNDGHGQEIPRSHSSSLQTGTPSQGYQLLASSMIHAQSNAFRLIASLINIPGSPSILQNPPTSIGSSKDAPPAPFDTIIQTDSTIPRTYITDETILRSALGIMTNYLQRLPEGDHRCFILQSVFGLIVLHLYEVNGDSKSLDAGVNATSLALGLVVEPNGFWQHIPIVVRNWSYGQRLLVERDGSIEKLATPMRLLKRCWEISENLHSIAIRDKRFLRTELGACLFDQYMAVGNLDDLDRAIEHLQAFSEDSDTSGHDLATLGLAYYQRFLQRGELDDLDRALHIGQKTYRAGTLNANPLPSRDDAAGSHLFGLALAERFKMTLDIQDLDKAITNCQKAIALLSPNHPLLSPYKTTLGCIIFARYEALDLPDLPDLRGALEVIQSAVSVHNGGLGHYTCIPPDAVHGYFLAVDGGKRNDLLAVQQGIRHLSNARKMFPGPSHLESHIENYLSQAMTCCFRITKSDDDLALAIHHASLAFNKAHEGSPYGLQLELELGRLLMTSYEHGHSEHRDEAIAHFYSVAISSTWPSIRLDAAIRWADAAELCCQEGVIDALEVALSILPSLAWAGNHMPIQYRMLASRKSEIASRAAISALDAGDPARAISYLESGRNILWAQSLQLRPEHMLPSGDERQREFIMLSEHLSRIHGRNTLQEPENSEPQALTEKLQDISSEDLSTLLPNYLNTVQAGDKLGTVVKRTLLDVHGTDGAARVTSKSRESAIDYQRVYSEASLHSGAKRWDTLRSSLDELRGQLSPAHCISSGAENNDLMAALNKGSIAIVNAYRLQCDAIIVSSDGQAIELQRIPLSDISEGDAQAWAESLRQGMQDLLGNIISITEYEEIYLIPVLRNLWKGLACPLLDHLRRLGSIKRVWWYPTGPFMFLPIHAASLCQEDQPGLPELLTSSYIPSIHSLIRAFKSSPAPFRILAVGQPETPGHLPLPSVIEEMDSIRELCQDSPESLTTLIGEQGTAYQVIKSLPKHTSLHFSCHAHQDETYPFHSAFFLHDGALKLSKLMYLDLSHVQFAYLSACLTSAGDISLPDECIHLAAGVQFAGVRSVVATMWDVDDYAAATATSEVYKHLLRNGVESADTTEAAEALQKAMLEMKANGIPLACRVPFIHLGV